MSTFRIVVILSWFAVALNFVLFATFPGYSRHVPYEIEGWLFLFALALSAVYKVSLIYRSGMSRSSH
jgi:hypothetical protein